MVFGVISAVPNVYPPSSRRKTFLIITCRGFRDLIASTNIGMNFGHLIGSVIMWCILPLLKIVEPANKPSNLLSEVGDKICYWAFSTGLFGRWRVKVCN